MAGDLPGWTPAPMNPSWRRGNFIETIEKRQGLKIACIEEVAYRMGYIDAGQLRRLAEPLAQNGYGQYLLEILKD